MIFCVKQPNEFSVKEKKPVRASEISAAWYTLRLSPGSGAEKRSKGWQHSTTCYHWTEESVVMENDHPIFLWLLSSSKILIWKIVKRWKKLSSLSGLSALHLNALEITKLQMCKPAPTTDPSPTHPGGAWQRQLGQVRAALWALLATGRQRREDSDQETHSSPLPPRRWCFVTEASRL